VVQWLERRRKDLVILAFPVRILLWDVGVGRSDETAAKLLRRLYTNEQTNNVDAAGGDDSAILTTCMGICCWGKIIKLHVMNRLNSVLYNSDIFFQVDFYIHVHAHYV
jgi:hypothetical protein